jgi:hypothetical protein
MTTSIIITILLALVLGYLIGRIDKKVSTKLLKEYRSLCKTQKEVIAKQDKVVMKCVNAHWAQGDILESIFDLVKAANAWEEELKAQGIDPRAAKLEMPETINQESEGE